MAFKKWILKAAVQKTIALLPYRNRINYWFQKYVTGGVELDGEHLHWKLTHARDHLAYWRQYGKTDAPLCLELGTGWYPIVPIVLYLNGARKIQTIDLNAHLTKATLRITLEKLIIQREKKLLDEQFPGIIPDRWRQLLEVAGNLDHLEIGTALSLLQIETIVGDARRLPLPDNSIDFICSNNTFEHIYPEVLAGILQSFKRVIKPEGIMSHFIDLSDHFAHFDSSINIYNFLRFSAKEWAMIDNAIQPQNRWRWPQYKALYRELDIPIMEESVRPGSRTLLNQVPIHKEWRKFTPEELAISHGYLIS